MYANPGTKWACPITIPCRNHSTNSKDSNTPCNHSKTLKTKGEKLHKLIIVTQESHSNQTKQENTNKSKCRK